MRIPEKIPQEYVGREQTYLKHLVLTHYVEAWAIKRGSGGRFRPTRLWYVDCFAGPWESAADDLRDTSVAIGLAALRAAAQTWKRSAGRIELAAIFVEKNARSYERLKSYLDHIKGDVQVKALHGEFGSSVNRIDELIGHDPAFLFVDPTGWKGAAMKDVAPLSAKRDRDVLINVMFNHIQRFKSHPRAELRQQIRDFFGLTDEDVPEDASEDELFELYRRQVREKCGVQYAADLAIRHPAHDRTWFRLVVGGHHPAVIELFRSIERKVCGIEAGAVATEVRERATGQISLFGSAPALDDRYARLRDDGLARAGADVLDLLAVSERLSFAQVWSSVLQDRHIAKTDLGDIVADLERRGTIVVHGKKPRQRKPSDDNVLSLVPKASRS